MSTLYLNLSFGVFFLAMVLYAAGLFSSKKVIPLVARFLMVAGALSLTVYIGSRWQAAGRPPFSNMFESLVVFAWAIAIFCIFIDWKYRIKSIAALVALMSLLALGYASLCDKAIVPLLPALKSNWLTIHVLTCFIGYAALTASFVSSVVLLFKKSEERKLDTISYRMIAFGFLFLTL